MSNEREQKLREFESLAHLDPDAFEAECRRVVQVGIKRGWIRQAEPDAKSALSSNPVEIGVRNALR